jgi:AraC-like DNA-binding protein
MPIRTNVQRRATPSTDTRVRATYVLPPERIDPVIRIAHRMSGPLNIGQRVIVDHELVLIIEGSGVFRLSVSESGTTETPFGSGTLLFIKPFVPHSFQSTGKHGKHIAVHFDFRANLPRRGSDLDRRRPYRVELAGGLAIPSVHLCARGDEIHGAMTRLIDAGAVDDTVANVAQRGHVLRIIASLMAATKPREKTGEGAPSADQRNLVLIDGAITQISNQLKTAWDADMLAATANLSPSHFTRLFRRRTSYAPMTYLRRLRVAAARALLAGDNDLSVKEVAVRCGFDDPYHFSKVFHQIDGLSPSDYRDAARAGRR